MYFNFKMDNHTLISFSQVQEEHLEHMKQNHVDNRSRARDGFRHWLKCALADPEKWEWDSYAMMAEILVYPSTYLSKRDVQSIVAEFQDTSLDFRLLVTERHNPGFGSDFIVVVTSSKGYLFKRILYKISEKLREFT